MIAAAATGSETVNRTRPPAVSHGDTVAIVAPAGRVERAALELGIASLQAKGLRVSLGSHLLDGYGHLAGTDRDRAADLMEAFLDPEVQAIFCARGGSGSARLLPHLDLRAIASHPKVFVGYSDVTILHLALARFAGWPTFYGPMVASDLGNCHNDPCFQALWKLISVPESGGIMESSGIGTTLIPGAIEGVLTGGTLCLVAGSLGTPYAAQVHGGILALEDTHEPPWRVDRMLTHLDHAGLLEAAAGFLIGSLSDPEDADATGLELSVEQSLGDHLRLRGKPVLYGFPFGHILAPLTLPLNCRVRLDATLKTVTVLESAVGPAR